MPADEKTSPAPAFGAMLKPEEAESQLREQGARMTAQRYAVLDILAGNRTHPTAEGLVAEVRERLGCVAPATIYNTLETLVNLGFVRRLDGLEQKAHFDPDTSDHQHAICLACREVWDIGPVAQIPDVPDGFTVLNTLIQGICEHCAHERP